MADLWVGVDDRRFLRAVGAGLVVRRPDGHVWEAGEGCPGRRDTRWRRAVDAGWVRELPDSRGVFGLTAEGERVLAASGRPVEVRRG